MYVNVKLLNGFPKLLTYKIPQNWSTENLIGTVVKVPIQKRFESALIVRYFQKLPSAITYVVKEVKEKEALPTDSHYDEFIKKLSGYYTLNPIQLYKRIRSFLKEAQKKKRPINPTSKPFPREDIHLTKEQQSVVDNLKPSISKQLYNASILHGVTGSGKTEIYKKLIEHAYQEKKVTILLLPEVSLAVQFTTLFKKSLNIPVYGFHSATSASEKKDLWSQLIKGTPLVIIGVHLPILLPIKNIGLIIIDEEHESGYQEKKHPRINTKEAAIIRAKEYSCPIILGSATPSLQSLHNVKTQNWNLFTVKKRFSGAFPTIKLVKLDGKVPRKNFWITTELERAIADRLSKKEQTIIFLNRRGYSFFLQCKACSFVFECPNCSVSLTLHSDNTLRCHYCTEKKTRPTECPSCKPKKDTLMKKGIGTQQVVSILEKLFPQACIARADMDSTINKKNWQETVTKFHNREIDILVGTQTITKGYHFPHVTLVGLLWADINLNVPFYNAAETTLQQIIQVAGRAGRHSKESLVIVQSMLDHPIFNYINEENYLKFYHYEINHRKELNYPPCARFVEIELRNQNESILEKESELCADTLIDITIENESIPMSILGPAQPPVHKIKNTFIRKIYIKSSEYKVLYNSYKKLLGLPLTSKLFFTPNPQN